MFFLVTKERRRNYLLSEPNYHTAKFFKENLLVKEMKKTQITMNKPVYSGLSILELSKTNVWILVWLHKTKIWWKCKTLLYGCRQLYCPCDNRWYLQKYCRRWETRLYTSN